MRSLGYDPRILRGDLGGEFDNSKFRKQAADLGMKVEYVSAERHVNSAEGAHLRIADVMRANNALTRGVLDLKIWGYSYMFAVNQINIAGGYFGADEDLTGCAPYGSLVAYYDLDLPKNQARASLGVYIGRRRDAGPGASWVVSTPEPGGIQSDLRRVRTTASLRFLVAPGERPRPVAGRHSTLYARARPLDRKPRRSHAVSARLQRQMSFPKVTDFRFEVQYVKSEMKCVRMV